MLIVGYPQILFDWNRLPVVSSPLVCAPASGGAPAEVISSKPMPQTAPVPGKKGQTPLMRQYYAIKERHPGTVLLFRMGDFYETFDTDAERSMLSWESH